MSVHLFSPLWIAYFFKQIVATTRPRLHFKYYYMYSISTLLSARWL